MAQKITKRSVDYSRWYTEIVQRGELADYAPVKGCMVIRPNGFALWQNMQSVLDRMFRETGHRNAYFPLFIPESFMKREAEHVEGFAPECAVVTHGGGEELEEPLYVRPTSETIIWAMYKRWIQSYRDLPLLINQWCNVVRWEMRTRLFLRTTEFLWQEGHTAHATAEEAQEEALKILEIYRTFAEEYMAMPVYVGRKSENEKFAGAVTTYTIEALMQDNRALQAGTSHYLGQNFAKAFDVTFQSPKGGLEYVYATSWGVSTRLIGALIMTHGDDQGVVFPPRLAPTQVIVIPIWRDDTEMETISAEARKIADMLKPEFTVEVDDRDTYKPGWKFNEWELRGVPLRIEIGPKDVENKQVILARRDSREKAAVPTDGLRAAVRDQLYAIQASLFEKAKRRTEEHTFPCDDYEEMKKLLDDPGGFIFAHWCGDGDCEKTIQEETRATIRCIPLNGEKETGKCIRCGRKSERRVFFARAY